MPLSPQILSVYPTGNKEFIVYPLDIAFGFSSVLNRAAFLSHRHYVTLTVTQCTNFDFSSCYLKPVKPNN